MCHGEINTEISIQENKLTELKEEYNKKSENPLYNLCLRIATKTTELVVETMDLDEITERFDFRDKKQTMVIIYHELMWDMLDDLEKQGIIQKPIAFSDPENAEAKDIADLVFIVRRK